MKRLLFFLSALVCSSALFAQQIELNGAVKDDAGAALEMANIIVLSSADSSMVSYAFTDNKGQFRLKVPQDATYILRISYLGFETLDRVVEVATASIALGEISLVKQSAVLKDVTVVEEMPIMISGDTISYKADMFNRGTEQKLEDVLKNLPGIEVDEDGQIKVEGKVVEKIMVDGKDFFDGDTKIASKNIPANAVDKVQVLRNYSDIGPMSGVTSNDDRVAINITLKEGKKSMLFGDMEAGAGPDGRYLVHPNLFLYRPKSSLNFIGDLNNVGMPAFTMRDYFRFSGGFRSMGGRGTGSSFSVANDIGIPMGNNDRNVEISSEFGALNLTLNPNTAWALNFFGIVNHNDITSRSNTINNYVGQDSALSMENIDKNGIDDNLSFLGKMTAKFTPNEKLYLAYNAFGKYTNTNGTDQAISDFNLVVRDIGEANEQTPAELTQKLELAYDINEKSILSFEAQHLFKRQDPIYNLLTNVKPNFGFIPVQDSGLYNISQFRLITTNKLDANLNYYYILNKTNHIELSAGTSITDQVLNSHLNQVLGEDTVELSDNALRNAVDFNLVDVFGGVHFKSKIKKLTIRPGLNLHYYRMNDLQWSVGNTRDWWFVLPDLFVRYDFKKSESITLDYQMQASFTDVNNMALGAIFQSYNSLFLGNNQLENALYHSTSLRYFSYSMYNFTTIFAGLTYNKRIQDITNTVTYLDIDRANTPINATDANDLWSAYGSYQRRFGYYRVNVGANLSYSLTNNLVNGDANQNQSLSQNYNTSFGTNFKGKPNVEIGYRVTLSNYTGLNVDNRFANHAPFINLEVPFKKQFLLDARYRYNYYSSLNTGVSSIYDFLDASLLYRTKSEKWEFKASATNLLNTEFIRQDSFSNSVTSTQKVYVLPRYLLLTAKVRI